METSAHPTVVRLVLPGSALEAAAGRSEDAMQLLLSVPWWCRWSPSRPGPFVSASLAGTRAAEVRVLLTGTEELTEIDVTSAYAFGATTAPIARDICGTFTIRSSPATDEARPPRVWRLVAIRADAVDLQAAHYVAGSHAFELVSSPADEDPLELPAGLPDEPDLEVAELLDDLEREDPDLPAFPCGLPLNTPLGPVTLTVTGRDCVYALIPVNRAPLVVDRTQLWGSVRVVRREGVFVAEVGPTDLTDGRRRPASEAAQRQVADVLGGAVSAWALVNREVMEAAHATVVGFRKRALRRELSALVAQITKLTAKVREKRDELVRLYPDAGGAGSQ